MLNRAYAVVADKKESIIILLSQFIFGIFGALFIHACFFGMSTPMVATVNINGIQESFLKETMNQGLDPVQMKAKVTKFAGVLDSTLVNLAKHKNLILVPSEAVIAGVNPDYTNVVANQVKSRLSK